jgi:hypothetical protein
MVTWGLAGRALSSMVSVRLPDNIFFLNSVLNLDLVRLEYPNLLNLTQIRIWTVKYLSNFFVKAIYENFFN